jgi:hypothetical protein
MLQKFIGMIKLGDKRLEKRMHLLLTQILTNLSNMIHSNVENKEYQANSRLVNSDICFDEQVNSCMEKNAELRLKESTDSCIYLPFDGSEIRKSCTKKSEKLAKVRSLDGKTVKGYHSYTTLAVSEHSHRIMLLNHKVYSEVEDNHLSKFVEYDALLASSSNIIKTANSKLVRKFILDREFDSARLFESMDLRGDKFIIRSKNNRNYQEKRETMNFNNPIKELKVKGHIYKNFNLNLKVEKVMLVDKYIKLGKEISYSTYTIITATSTKDGNPIFKSKPDEIFSIITNQEILTQEEAMSCYLAYFLRWKIETVFKFLKDTLGLEDFRVRSLKAIKNIIALTFLAGSYLIDLGKFEGEPDEFIIELAILGNAPTVKGKLQVTLFYVSQGISNLLTYTRVKSRYEKLSKSKQRVISSKI